MDDHPLITAARRRVEVESLTEASDRAKALGEILNAIPGIQRTVRAERQTEVLAMRAAGMKDAEIAEELGITWARVSAIARGVADGGSAIRRRQHSADGHG
jgi:DNA-binding NarL/FixJ family response regulator